VAALCLIGLVGALTACQGATTQTGTAMVPTPEEAKRLDASLADAAVGSEQHRDFIAAAAYYRALYNREPDNVSAIVGLSRSLRRLGKPVEAQAIVRRGLAKMPREADLLAEMGKLQLALSNAPDAIESLSRTTAAGARRWDVYSALAVAYDRIGMYDQAARRYEQALELAPENAVVLNNYALSQGQTGQLEAAVALLERAIALPEATPRMRQNLALFYALRGDLPAAEILVRRDMDDTDAANNLAYLRALRSSTRGTGSKPMPHSGIQHQAPAPAPPVLAAQPPPAAKPAAPEGAPTPPALPLGEVTAEPVAPPATPVAPLRHHADEFQAASPATAAADPVAARPSVGGDAPAVAPDGVPSSAPETSG